MSTVSAEQIAEARSIAPVVCVQNFYNIAHRDDDDLIDALAKQNISYVPYFPLGGFTPLQSAVLVSVAARLNVTPMAVALAWLLQRSTNILLMHNKHAEYLIFTVAARVMSSGACDGPHCVGADASCCTRQLHFSGRSLRSEGRSARNVLKARSRTL